ncbi:CPBP family intramembrane glutamic endopeptidase [Leifsonia sp. ALI-44-B]|uniref:CPBP family intramembrane glutamic endopeptidase n=1 Tax=Leifsonia sp. ALI-44-B TaxID=1933776 RepID=UPI001EE6AE5E|nr:CPBP family intramembrane glutamic endopeptidase [Leifsonia sp. ALI-44-B]
MMNSEPKDNLPPVHPAVTGRQRLFEGRAALPGERARVWWEIAIVLGLSLGASAVYSIVSLLSIVTAGKTLAGSSTSLNSSQSPREWLDFTYQFLSLFFALVPVALALYLLWRPGRSAFRRVGLDLTQPGRDLGRGLLLLAVIGVPGIAFYAVGRMLGLTVAVNAAPLEGYWWTIPMLIFSAIRAGLQEEVIVVAYLFEKLRQLGWNTWSIILSTSLLRGSYHLYQGVGPFVGNVVMGVVFGWCYQRWGRVMPLVVAHAIIDIVSFVGYPLAAAWWPGIFTVGS